MGLIMSDNLVAPTSVAMHTLTQYSVMYANTESVSMRKNDCQAKNMENSVITTQVPVSASTWRNSHNNNQTIKPCVSIHASATHFAQDALLHHCNKGISCCPLWWVRTVSLMDTIHTL